MWGFPIVSREGAGAVGVDAVILSSDAHEAALLANCGPLQDREGAAACEVVIRT